MFVDGLDTGRDRRIYILIIEKMNSGPRYTTYDSYPKSEWIPVVEEVVSRVNIKKKKAKVLKSKFQYRPKIGPKPIRGIPPTLAIHRKQMTIA